MSKKTNLDAVYSCLKGRKRGITAAEISQKTGVSVNTVRSYLLAFRAEGKVEVVGKVETGTRGRPALLYTA